MAAPLVCGLLLLTALAATKPLTVAEATGYRATASPDQVAAFLQELAKSDPRCELQLIGRSVEGRPLLSVRLGSGPAVLLLGGIHAGECAGKEAILQLVRDELQRDQPRWTHRLRIIAIPDFNTDGNARRGRHHRPHQQGPIAGMGVRHNAQRLNLNRDFVKLQTPEVRALVRLLNHTRPLLVVDTHTTNGSEHAHDLLFDFPHHPAVAEPLRRYLTDELLPQVQAGLNRQGISTNYYGNFDPKRTSWRTFGFGARYSTEYCGLRGTFALLSEAYARAPYGRRVEVTRGFLEQVLDYTVAHLDQMIKLQRQASQPRRLGTPVPIDGTLTSRGKIRLHLRDNKGNAQTIELEHLARIKPTKHAPRPWAYAIAPTEARLVDRLLMHGVRVARLRRAATVNAHRYTVLDWSRAAKAFEGHRLVRLTVKRHAATLTLPAGTYLVPVDQPLGTLAMTLLEPEARDSLVAWNFLDHRLRRDTSLPILSIPQPVAVELEPVERVEPLQRLTVEMLFDPQRRIPFSGAMPPRVTWLPDSQHYLLRTGDRWLIIDARTGAEEPAYDRSALARAWAQLPGISSEEARRLAARGWDVLDASRWQATLTVKDDLYLVDLKRAKVHRLTHDPAREELVTFSPTGQMLAYVKEYTLYVYDLVQRVERRLSPRGDEAHRYGKLDWVYQEEIYGRGNYRGYWWSPDGNHIAFLYLDEAGVHRYPIVRHLPYRAALEEEYYPKAGDPLPRVQLGIVSVLGGKPRWVDLDQYVAGDRLVVRVGFRPDGRRVVFQLQNREQTWLKLLEASLDGAIERVLVEEKADAWVEVLGEPVWLDDHRFLWLSDRSGQRHIYLVDSARGSVHAVTEGDWNVIELYGVSSDRRHAFFRGLKDSPLGAQVYRVELGSGRIERLTDGRGSHRARFAPAFNYFIDYRSDLLTPPSAWLHDATGHQLWAIEPNLVDYHRYVQSGEVRFVQVRAADGFPLECMAVLPVGFQPGRQYPVLCYVYGGPQAPIVQRRWMGSRLLWFQLLAQRGVLVWLCDNRSSSLKGIRYTHSIYGRLGMVELRDLLDSLRWLRRQGWSDPERIAIHGWSYGGYMAALAALKSEAFRLAIAGAPVTDWRNYDAIYTERYMRMPQNNREGYEETALPRLAAKLSGKLVLIHGLIDDNVHPANTLQLVDALQREGKAFELMIYPESRHGIASQKVRHLYEFMTQRILQTLRPTSSPGSGVPAALAP